MTPLRVAGHALAAVLVGLAGLVVGLLVLIVFLLIWVALGLLIGAVVLLAVPATAVAAAVGSRRLRLGRWKVGW